ncbi:hypothetical protein AR686_07335 [Chryseobacterium aquaticum subsp. greenlandense]|uniref:Uncharacterized protein n=2 Tax=Chryseobacterium group TaxID=2782232 RepID=A0A117KBQ4_9FLAO|nr:hypothetical protein AR686_07335 [Chryseobacterium aquaticum subsp. greenlandense]
MYKESFVMYRRFLILAIVMFMAKYFILYAMIYSRDTLILNLKDFHMTLLMISGVLLLELLFVMEMFRNKELKSIIILQKNILETQAQEIKLIKQKLEELEKM